MILLIIIWFCRAATTALGLGSGFMTCCLLGDCNSFATLYDRYGFLKGRPGFLFMGIASLLIFAGSLYVLKILFCPRLREECQR